MYETHFSLKERPFTLSPDPRFIFLSSQHQEALAKCEFAVKQKMGLAVTFGDIGMGKTSIARRILQQFGDDTSYNLAVLVHPNYPSPFQLVREIRREFGLDKPRRSLTDELIDLQKFLVQEHLRQKTNVVVIDEAQTLRPPLFEVLRQLLNYETNTHKLVQVLLFGQNQLATKLDRLPEFKDRVAIWGALSGLSVADTNSLIAFRWRVAGGDEHPFTQDALDAIFRYSSGRPRQLCKICDTALIKAFSRGLSHIDESLIHEAAQDIRLVRSPSEPPPHENVAKKSAVAISS